MKSRKRERGGSVSLLRIIFRYKSDTLFTFTFTSKRFSTALTCTLFYLEYRNMFIKYVTRSKHKKSVYLVSITP